MNLEAPPSVALKHCHPMMPFSPSGFTILNVFRKRWQNITCIHVFVDSVLSLAAGKGKVLLGTGQNSTKGYILT